MSEYILKNSGAFKSSSKKFGEFKNQNSKNYSTFGEKEKQKRTFVSSAHPQPAKIFKEIDELYSVVLGVKFFANFDCRDKSNDKSIFERNLIDDEEEDEIQTSRFPQSEFQHDLVPDEFSRRKHQRSRQYDTKKNKSVLQKVKTKLKKLKRENKKNKQVLSAVNHLLKIVAEELKFSRSTSIPRLKKTGELFNSNLLYEKTENKEIDNYLPNPDTFRKLDSDRGYESQGINSLMMPNMMSKTESKVIGETMQGVEQNQLKLPLHLLNPTKSQKSHNSAAVSNRGKFELN